MLYLFLEYYVQVKDSRTVTHALNNNKSIASLYSWKRFIKVIEIE